MLLNLGRCREVSLGKLNAYASLTIALGPFGRNPNHLAIDRYFLRFVHQGEEDKDLFAQFIALIGRDK